MVYIFRTVTNVRFSLQWALDDDVKAVNCFSLYMFGAFMIQVGRRVVKTECRV